MAFLALFFTVVLSLCVLGLCYIAVVAIWESVRGDRTLKKNRARNALGRLVIWTAWSEASARANAGDRAARERAQEMEPSHAENFKKSTHTPTFKKPLKARLLLFDLFVQSEPAMLMGPPRV